MHDRTQKLPATVGTLVLFGLLLCVPSMATPPVVTIELLNPPPGGLLELEVGESYTFDVEVSSDQPFILAMASTDAYYPGRYVSWHGNDRAHHATSAVLHLTMTGKSTTVGLPEVHDWPEPGVNWSEGTAPLSLVVGTRYEGGVVIAERFSFAVRVP